MTKYNIFSKFRGYENRQDETTVDNMNHAVLLPPSQNVILHSDGLIKSRGGTEAFGDILGQPVLYNKHWMTNRDFSTTVITSGKKLYASLNDNWVEIMDVNTDDIDTAVWWHHNAKRDELIIADGTKSLHNWSGILGKLTYINGDEIGSTKSMDLWGLEVNDILMINGTEYVVQSVTAEGYAKLDAAPTAVIGDLFFSKPTIKSLFQISWTPSDHSTSADVTDADMWDDFNFLFDTIDTKKNQLIAGSNKTPRGFMSKNTDWSDFRYNLVKGRIRGEGDTFVLDSPISVITVEPQKGRIIISCGEDNVYEITEKDVTVSAEVSYTNSVNNVRKLMTGFKSGFMNKSSATLVKDSLAFIGADNTFNTLSRIEHNDTQQGKPLSWLVESDFNSFDMSNTQTMFLRNNFYIAIPEHQRIMIYDFELAKWQPPIILPVSSIGFINGKPFYFDIQGQAHWLFVGTNDNGSTIVQRAVFHYENSGQRANMKYQTKNYTEGYVSTGGVVDIKLINDYAGSTEQINKTIIHGSKQPIKNPTLFYSQVGLFGYGRYNFGMTPFGNVSDTDSNDYSLKINKFRDFWGFKSENFFEQRFEIAVDTTDTVFALIAFGQDTMISSIDPSKQ